MPKGVRTTPYKYKVKNPKPVLLQEEPQERINIKIVRATEEKPIRIEFK